MNTETNAGIYYLRIITSSGDYYYIGQTRRSFQQRWREHLCGLRAGQHANTQLQQLYRDGAVIVAGVIVALKKNHRETTHRDGRAASDCAGGAKRVARGECGERARNARGERRAIKKSASDSTGAQPMYVVPWAYVSAPVPLATPAASGRGGGSPPRFPKPFSIQL